jgi:hypothetical protein
MEISSRWAYANLAGQVFQFRVNQNGVAAPMDEQINLQEFLIQFQDHVAPKLDTYEQAIYI